MKQHGGAFPSKIKRVGEGKLNRIKLAAGRIKVIEHIPVLLSELVKYLRPKPAENFIDATVGIGGHSKMVLSKTAPNGKILGIDCDPNALDEIRKKLAGKRLILYQSNFKNLKEIVEETGFKKFSGIYFDLGIGSWQIGDDRYGLSFHKDMPLDMRLSIASGRPSAKEVVNKESEKKLTEIFREYGDVRRPHQIARKITKYREKKAIESTLELVRVTGVKNPAVLAKIFQALRIFVNNELENLDKTLPAALELLKKGGRLVVISYHSGEDRIVKNFFREQANLGKLKIITKKPVVPSKKEIRENTRARSAKLRAAEKIS